MYTTIANSN